MIPVLYNKSETTFTHNGTGLLSEAVKATVTEERNGSYELSLQYPITGRFYSEITEGAIIKAKANETSEPQLFRIYKSSKPINGIVTYSAEHISYDLNGIPLLGFSIKNATPQMALTKAIEGAALPCPFTAYSNISTLNSTEILTPCSVRALLGGQTGSLLDVWGGEYEFDNFTVKLYLHRGKDNGVVIEYGKNLKDLKQESNIAECYTHLMPYAVCNTKSTSGNSEKATIYLREKVLPLSQASNIGHYKAFIMDFSDRFGDSEQITEEKLRAKATAYAAAADLGTPKVNITVSFVQLWQTEEYKNIAPLERVKLCDTITVKFAQLGVNAKSKVIKTVYDCLKEKYESITLGDAKSSLADTINNQTEGITAIKTETKAEQEKIVLDYKAAIENATKLITGQSGGYVVLNPAEKPQEILILDAPTISEAVNVWRWNSGGLGHSSTGYNGVYKTAITADGKIVADFIKSGELSGQTIKGSSISGTTINGGSINGTTINGGTITGATFKQEVGQGDTGTFFEIGQAEIKGGYNAYSTAAIDLSVSMNPSKSISYDHTDKNNRHFGMAINTYQKRNGQLTNDGGALILSTDQIWTRTPGGNGYNKNYTGEITVTTPNGLRTFHVMNGLIVY